MPIVSYTEEEMKVLASKVDMERIRNMSDDEIDYSDIPELTDEDIASGKVRTISKDELMSRLKKSQVSVSLSTDIVNFFKNMGDDWESRINDALHHLINMKEVFDVKTLDKRHHL